MAGYKLKTHKGTAKRFKITPTGKVMGTKGHHGHLRRHQSKRVLRQLEQPMIISHADSGRIKKLLPYG